MGQPRQPSRRAGVTRQVNGNVLQRPAPTVLRAGYARRETISPQHSRTATAFARLLERLSPALAEKYVLPWAGGTPRIDRLCAAVTSATTRPAKRLATSPEAQNLAVLCREAMRQAWRDGAGPGGSMFEDAAQRAVDGLTGEDAADCLAVLASARPVDTYLATPLLAIVARQSSDRPTRAGWQTSHRWLPFLASTVRAHGLPVPPHPAAPAGPVGGLRRARPARARPARRCPWSRSGASCARARAVPPPPGTKARSCWSTAHSRPMHRCCSPRAASSHAPRPTRTRAGPPTAAACPRWPGAARRKEPAERGPAVRGGPVST